MNTHQLICAGALLLATMASRVRGDEQSALPALEKHLPAERIEITRDEMQPRKPVIHLRISGGVKGAGWLELTELKHLRSLTIFTPCKYRANLDAAVTALGQLQNLRSLELQSCEL